MTALARHAIIAGQASVASMATARILVGSMSLSQVLV